MRSRIAQLMLAGLIDSLCLSFAWTVLMLQIVADYGLGAAGLTSAAMLVGIALSAPAASHLARLLDGRRLLRSAASAEALMRMAVFALLATSAPLPSIVVCVSIMNVTAWTGYAGMRAEVAAVSPGTSALTWYGTGVAAIEAVGAAAAALLPLVADMRTPQALGIVTVVYVLGLVPTIVVAGGSPITRPHRRPLAAPGALLRRLRHPPAHQAMATSNPIQKARRRAPSRLKFRKAAGRRRIARGNCLWTMVISTRKSKSCAAPLRRANALPPRAQSAVWETGSATYT